MSDCSLPTISAIIESKNVEPYIPSVQSANSLFRFFGEQSFLFDALKKNALIPRYYIENVDYLTIEYKNIAYPMVCFCDITVHRLANHIDYYGPYEIAFSKEWGSKKEFNQFNILTITLTYANSFVVLLQKLSKRELITHLPTFYLAKCLILNL